MASDESYERLMKYFDNLQRTIDDTRNGISKMERDYEEWKHAASLSETKSYATF